MTAMALRVAPARLVLAPAMVASLALVAAGTGLIARIVPLAAVVALARPPENHNAP